MLEVIKTNNFLKDFKLSKKRGLKSEKLYHIVTLLSEGKELPRACRPHILSGTYDNLWACHVAPDWLLIYDIDIIEKELWLFRTGTHSDLF